MDTRAASVALMALALAASAGCTPREGRPRDANADNVAVDTPNRTDTVGATSTGSMAPASRAFALATASGGMMEVELGNLAQQRAASAKVKELGQRLASDHTKANNELKELVAAKGVTLPVIMGDEHKATVDKLAQLSATAFDREYINTLVASHQKAITNFEDMAKSADDPEIKVWAAKTLPTLKEHLRSVEALQKAT